MAPRSGRRPGSPDTRAEILDAARRAFAEVGYDRATIRGIAERAGVDPSLVHHYFGTKDGLFSASIDLPMMPTKVVGEAVAAGSGGLGERLARLFFEVWEREEPRNALLGMLRGAMGGDDAAVRAFREFVVAEVRDQVADTIGGPGADLRALAIASQLVGVALLRYVVRIEPFASASVDEIVATVAPRLQAYIDGA